MKDKSLNILLLHPEISRTKYDFAGVIENECLDLEYLYTLLKSKGHNVEIFDVQVERTSAIKKIQAFNPDVLYVSGRVKQENFILEYCEEAKNNNPNTITIIGGIHAQLCYQRMYKSYVDYILTTFDIYKIVDILDHSIPLSEIDGICYQQEGVWVKNQPCIFDIKKLPRADRTYFYKHADRYRYLELKAAACVRTAYSCPYRCKFCLRNKMNGGRYVYRDIEDVVDEIESIQSDNIYFVDDDFLISRKRILAFIELIKARNIQKRYVCFARSDFIAKNEDVMVKLKKIGFTYVLVGLEAIDDHQLAQYNKKSSKSNNVTTIEICNRLGINIMGMFILDLSYTSKDFKKLYQWIKAHHLKHVAVSIYLPEMGLESYELYKDRFITDNPSHWDYLHVVAKPDHLSVRRYYFHYYILLIKLFLKAQREGVYDFIDYKDYIFTFIKSIFKNKRKNDDL